MRIDRRRFLQLMVSGAVVPSLAAAGCSNMRPNGAGRKPYNVLFLAVDDMNDWVGCLGGHPQAITPNIDRLAGKGVLFEQAYCASPLCNPSRTAIMTGLHPSTTGIYGNRAWFRDTPRYRNWDTIPQHFRRSGYAALTGGKIYHQADGKFSDPVAWDEQYHKSMGTPYPPPGKRYQHGLHGKFSNKIFDRLIDWSPIDQPDEATSDWKSADLAAKFLREEHDKPFFLACGVYRPHLSWYAPRKYFQMHPLEDIQLPVYKENDLDDVPPVGHRMAGKEFGMIRDHGQWRNAVQGYLACSTFADACVGRVLDALEKSSYRDSTIVVLWGDHGYHIGEKNHLAKLTLWEEACRTPLIIYAPGISKGASRCSSPVSLVDLYPTLIDLCGLPGRDGLDGRSLEPLVREPGRDWPHPVLVSHGSNYAVRSRPYHYIHYEDGGEELYDNAADPYGWKNLAGDRKYAAAKEEMRRSLPMANTK